MHMAVVTFPYSLLCGTIHVGNLERMKKEYLLEFYISTNILTQLALSWHSSVKPLCSSWLVSYPVHCWQVPCQYNAVKRMVGHFQHWNCAINLLSLNQGYLDADKGGLNSVNGIDALEINQLVLVFLRYRKKDGFLLSLWPINKLKCLIFHLDVSTKSL